MAVTAQNAIEMNLDVFRGLSAYEIAVKNGFVGTEQKWLESLKGDPGVDGDAITVNRKRAVDGNISLRGTDIYMEAGMQNQTVTQAIYALEKDKLGSSRIANNLTTEDEGYVLDARQGKAIIESVKNVAFELKAILYQFLWDDVEPYTQTVEADGVQEDDTPIIDVDMTGAATKAEMEALAEAWSLVLSAYASENAVIVAFSDKPEIDIPIKIKVVR